MQATPPSETSAPDSDSEPAAHTNRDPSARFRVVCYRCHKPSTHCVCARTPTVANRTPIVVLQHVRERFHPIGTARLVRLGLDSVEVRPLTGSVPRPTLPEGAALLYPSPGARDLAELEPAERPRSLIVLDGTWHQARRLYLDNPWLQALPAVRFTPDAPSRYRIRRQSSSDHLSTVESIVTALRMLEPDLGGLDELLAAFESMIADQVACIGQAGAEPRCQLRRPRTSRAVPRELIDGLERLVVVYGETAPVDPGGPSRRRRLVSWTALRPATGDTFERIVASQPPPSREHLAHMQLDPSELSAAVPLEQLAREWRRFRRHDDLLAAWNSGRVRMLRSIDADAGAPLLLKALWCNVTHEKCGALDDLVARRGLSVSAPTVRGRAAERLGQAAAVARLLVSMAPAMARAERRRSPPAE